jgi:hypothetical protein
MRHGWVVAAVALAAAVGAAQTPGGEAVPAGFRSYVVTDDRFPPKPAADPKAKPTPDPRTRTNKMHDLVVEHGLNPTLAVFARTPPGPDVPAARLVQQLHPLMEKELRGTNFGAFVVFLTLDAPYPDDEMRGVKADAVRDLAAQLKAPRIPFGLAPAKSDQTDAWKVGDDTTAVLYNQMRVVRRWDKVDDAAIKDILATVAKMYPAR